MLFPIENKLCPKVILEGTRQTFKTEIAFELNERGKNSSGKQRLNRSEERFCYVCIMLRLLYKSSPPCYTSNR